MQRYELLLEVAALRRLMPRLGGRKLLHCLYERVPALLVGIGRDAFFDLLREVELLVTAKKQYRVKTTDSRHSFRRYPDLYNEYRTMFLLPFTASLKNAANTKTIPPKHFCIGL
jgi:hypothetical protein